MISLIYSKGEFIMSEERKENKKNLGNMILLTVIGIATLLIAVVGATFAYFTAILTGNETTPPLTITSGTIGTQFDGGAVINLENIYPRDEVWETKTFSIMGNTDAAVQLGYSISLVINENTFGQDAAWAGPQEGQTNRDGVLMFTLEVDPASSANGQTLTPVTTQTGIPRVGPVALGTGHFAGPITGTATHTYHLRFFFPDRGFNQNAEQQKVFRAHIHAQEA